MTFGGEPQKGTIVLRISIFPSAYIDDAPSHLAGNTENFAELFGSKEIYLTLLFHVAFFSALKS